VRYDLLKILLVDDNHYMRVLLAEILRAIGVKDIFEANDGAEGLQMMRDHPVDIVMTDLSMQPLDGIDFVRLLRNSPDSPNQMTPVIMVTGHSTFTRVNEARDAGVNEFLVKPLTGARRDRAAAPGCGEPAAVRAQRGLLRPGPPPPATTPTGQGPLPALHRRE
jgi:CheY-like chemotaxis protein